MTENIEFKRAIAGTKIKASDWNYNFDAMQTKLNDEIANTDLTNLSETGVARFVKRAGDTMTGDLTIQNDSLQKVSLVHTGLDSTSLSAPVSTVSNQIVFCDKNNNTYGTIEGKFDTDNAMAVSLIANRTVNEEEKQAQASVYVDGDGESYFSFPMCDTAPTAESTASKNKVAVVVENYRNELSGYRVWSDGLIEQWGIVYCPGAVWTQVALLKPYSDCAFLVQVSARDLVSMTSDGTTLAGAPLYDDPASVYIGHSWYGNTGTTLVNWYTIGY